MTPRFSAGERIQHRFTGRPGTVRECYIKRETSEAERWQAEYRVQWDDAEPDELQTMFYATIIALMTTAQPHGGGEDAANA